MFVKKPNQKVMKITLLAIIVTAFLFNYGQSQPVAPIVDVVSMDKQMHDSIEMRTIELEGRLYGSINFRLFGNDSLLVEYQAFDINSYAKNMSFLHGDTIKTVGFLNFIKFGFGYSVLLSNENTCSISCVIASESGTLKLHKEDTLSESLIVPCVSSELIIPSKPKFKQGEIVLGKINLISSDFYDVEEDAEIKYRLELTGYFKTEVF